MQQIMSNPELLRGLQNDPSIAPLLQDPRFLQTLMQNPAALFGGGGGGGGGGGR